MQSSQNFKGYGVIGVRKGEHLFREGDTAPSFFFLKIGMIQIYRTKDGRTIEIEKIHAGQLVGDLDFLEGRTRSHCAMALTQCELIEISGESFQNSLDVLPVWLNKFIHALLLRVRWANKKIKRLEPPGETQGEADKLTAHLEDDSFLSYTAILRIFDSLLFLAYRHGNEVDLSLFLRHGSEIMGVRADQARAFLGILQDLYLVEIDEQMIPPKIMLIDFESILGLMDLLSEEELSDRPKRYDLTVRSFYLMNILNKYLSRYPMDPKTRLITANLAEIRLNESNPEEGTQPFKLEEFVQLVKRGYIGKIDVKSGTEIFTTIDFDKFSQIYRLQKLILAVSAYNSKETALS